MLDFDLAAFLHGGMFTTLKICAPLLLAPLAAGLVISIIQAITQINDSTVSFLPKLLASFAAAWFAGPYMSRVMSDYMHNVMDALITIGSQ